MRRSAIVAIVIVAWCGFAQAAQAQDDAYTECLGTKQDIIKYLRVMQSCSDAYWIREDVGEADALCAAARSLAGEHQEALERQLDYGADKESPNRACSREHVRPYLGLLIEASDWSLAFLNYRLRSKGRSAPPPLKIIRFGEVD